MHHLKAFYVRFLDLLAVVTIVAFVLWIVFGDP